MIYGIIHLITETTYLKIFQIKKRKMCSFLKHSPNYYTFWITEDSLRYLFLSFNKWNYNSGVFCLFSLTLVHTKILFVQLTSFGQLKRTSYFRFYITNVLQFYVFSYFLIAHKHTAAQSLELIELFYFKGKYKVTRQNTTACLYPITTIQTGFYNMNIWLMAFHDRRNWYYL